MSEREKAVAELLETLVVLHYPPRGKEPGKEFTIRTLPEWTSEDEWFLARQTFAEAVAALPHLRAGQREEIARMVRGDVYKENYRTWPAIPGYTGNRSNESEIVRHCDKLAEAILALQSGHGEEEELERTNEALHRELDDMTERCRTAEQRVRAALLHVPDGWQLVEAEKIVNAACAEMRSTNHGVGNFNFDILHKHIAAALSAPPLPTAQSQVHERDTPVVKNCRWTVTPRRGPSSIGSGATA